MKSRKDWRKKKKEKKKKRGGKGNPIAVCPWSLSGAPGDLDAWPLPLRGASALLSLLELGLISWVGVEVVLFSSDGGVCISSLYPDALFVSRNGG